MHRWRLAKQMHLEKNITCPTRLKTDGIYCWHFCSLVACSAWGLLAIHLSFRYINCCELGCIGRILLLDFHWGAAGSACLASEGASQSPLSETQMISDVQLHCCTVWHLGRSKEEAVNLVSQMKPPWVCLKIDGRRIWKTWNIMMIDRQMLGHPIFSQTLMRQPLLGEDGLCCEAEAGDNAIHSIHGSCLIHGHGSQGLAACRWSHGARGLHPEFWQRQLGLLHSINQHLFCDSCETPSAERN